MAAAPLDSSSTPPRVAAASTDQTRFNGDPMEDNDSQSTRKRPRLDSGSGVTCESWSTDAMSGRTAAVSAVDGGADDAAAGQGTSAPSRPASRVTTINTKSPTIGSGEQRNPSFDDRATSFSSSSTVHDQPRRTAPPAQSADLGHSKAISLSSTPAQSPEIEVADLEDVDQEGNTSNWKPLGEALREPEVVQLHHDQLSLTEMFPKLHENMGLRENLEEVSVVLEKGSPQDTAVFVTVKSWLEQVVNNLDVLTHDTFTDDRDFWDDFPVLVDSVLRRVQPFQPDEGEGPFVCFQEFFVSFARLTLHLVGLDTVALSQMLVDTNVPAPEILSKSYLVSLAWTIQIFSIPFFGSMKRYYGSEVINLVSRINDQIAAPPIDTMRRLSEFTACILALVHRWSYLAHVLFSILTLAHNMADSANERTKYGADDALIASPVCSRTAHAVYNLFRAVDETYQAHITKKIPWVTSESSDPVLRLISLTYCILSQREPNLRNQLAKALSIEYPEDATVDECSLMIQYGWKFGVLKKHIMDGRMELRVHGIETMQVDLVTIWRQHIQNSPAGREHPLVTFLVKFLRDHKIVEYIVGIDSHPQIISRSGNVVGFLIVTSGYRDSDTDIIWKTVTESQDSRTVSEVLGMLTTTFPMHDSASPVLLNVCSKLLELPLNRFDGRMVDFCDQLFHQMREKHDQRNNYDTMDNLHVDAVPLRLCVRLIRESVAVEDASVEHKALLQRFASSQLGHFSVTGLSETDKLETYERCIQDIAEMNEFTVGSVQALNALLSGQDAQEVRKLATEFDLTRLAIDEIAHAIDASQTDFSDPFSRNGFISRVHMLARIIDKVPDTITTELGDTLWKKIFTSTVLVPQGRRTLWEMLCGLTANGFKRNPFIERCIHEFIPEVPPEEYTPELLAFAKQSIIYGIRFDPPSRAGENEVVTIPGMDRIWNFILTAPPGSIETNATNFAIEVYLDHNVIRNSPRSAVEATHVALVDRCVEQLKSAATELKSNGDRTPNSLNGSMATSAVEKELCPAELSFSRSLLFLRQFLQGLRCRPQYTPPQGHPPDPPGAPVKGEPLEIRYQSFNGVVQSPVQTMRIGELSTASEFAEKIVGHTGFTKFRIYHCGQKVDLHEKPELSLREMNFGAGLLLIRKDVDAPEVAPAGRRQSLTPVDSEVLKHFDDLYDLLSLEDHLAREIYDFLVVFPPQDRVLELVKSEDKNEDDILPMGKPYSFLYSMKALSTLLREEAAKPSPSSRFVSHSIRVLVAALTRSEMSKSMADSSAKLLFATSLVDCLLSAFLVSLPPADDSSLVTDPAQLIQQLLHMMAIGPHIPMAHLPEAGIQKLICNSFAILTEGSVRDRKFWGVVKREAEFDRLLSSLLLEENRQPIRKEISENIALVCKFLQKPNSTGDENPMQTEIVKTIWDAFVQTIPQTPAHAHQSREFFEVALLMFHTAANFSSDLGYGEYLMQWSGVMLVHQHQEFVGRELVDHHLLGLIRLLCSCLRRARFANIPVDTFDLAEKLFDRYLFPDLSMGSDEVIVPRAPVMHDQTRMGIYNMLTMLVEDDKNYLKVVDRLGDSIAHDYTYSSAWSLDRQQMIRSPVGYAGLKNLSNTCYLNSLLTQLFMNIEFRDFMVQLRVNDPGSSQKLLDETKKLFAYMQETWLKGVDPQGLVDTIQTYDNEPIDVTIQMDVDEFYNLLFDRWESQIFDEEEKKKFRTFYGGQLVQQIKSKECTHISERLEPFSAIQCDIKGKASLEESLQAYVEGEIMQGDNKYSCTSCGRHVDAVKRACLKDVPDNLIFHLKRFDFDMITMMRNKINDEFQFPEYIDMSPFKVEYLSEQNAEVGQDVFELVGVLVHSGTAESGHYYSYIRERPATGSSGWVEFNDSDVSRFDPSKIADQCFGGVNDPTHPNSVRYNKVWNAYMLFYQRVSRMDASRSIYKPTFNNVPTGVSVPLPLKNHIAMENELFIRMYCLLDPRHATFIQYILSRLHDMTDSEAVADCKLDRSVVFIALDTLEQLVSRTKDASELDGVLSGIFRAITDLPVGMGTYRVLEWVSERPASIRNLVLKSLHAGVRSGSIRIMVASVARLRELRELEDDNERGKWQQLYMTAFEGIVASLEGLWPVLHTVSRSWDDYFEFLVLLASFGTYEAGIVLDSGFLLRCLEIVWLDREDAKRLKRHYLGYVKLVDKGRRFSQKKLIDLMFILLSNIDLSATPTADDERESLSDGRYPLTVAENAFIRPVGRARELVFLKKLLQQNNNPQTAMSILDLFLDAEPDAGLMDPICKMLEDGLRYSPAEFSAPFLEATLHFCRHCPDEQRILYIIDYVGKGVESIQDSGGPAHLTFYTNLLDIRNERLGLDETWFLNNMIEKIPDWAPTLLVYPESGVRNMTLEVLRQLLFNGENEELDEDMQSRYAEISKELMQSCVYKIRRTYLSTPGQAIEAKVVEAIKAVVDHCLATYFDNSEEDQLLVQQAQTVSSAIEELAADIPEELASNESDAVLSPEEWEDNSMIASDSEMGGLPGSP